MSANASCYDKSTGRLVGSNKSVTSVLVSPGGLYRAYAESEAVAQKGPGGKLYVTYDIARQFPGYGERGGARSSEFADRIVYHLRRA